MSFLVAPLKDFVHLPYVVLSRKAYSYEDVEEWVATVFKTMAAAGFFYASWATVYKVRLDWDSLILMMGTSMVQYGLHPYACYISTSYFCMTLGVDHLIKGLTERHSFFWITGSVGLVGGIAGLYRAKKYKEAKLYSETFPDRYPESLLDTRFHTWAQAMVGRKNR